MPEFEVRLACEAMRCRFELLLHGDEPTRLRAAGEEAIEEIHFLDRQLNFYSPGSEVSRLNEQAGKGPVRVEPRLFDLLRECKRLWTLTNGIFDPTVRPASLSSEKLTGDLAHGVPVAIAGMDRVRLRRGSRQVRFTSTSVSINLGGIGKGYALDRVAEILREAAVSSALLHAGTSSVLAIGEQAWKVGVASPQDDGRLLARVSLCDGALSVSGRGHRAAEESDQGGRSEKPSAQVRHPLTGQPGKAHVAAVLARSAAVADALSTALLCEPDPQAWLHETRGVLWLEGVPPVLRDAYPRQHPQPMFETG